MERASAIALHDILKTIDAVAEMVANLDLDGFQADYRTQRAVERCIEIVSEASRRIPAAEKVRFPEVPWPEIAGIGNILRHEYHRVAMPVVWRTATRSLPELRPTIAAMLADAGKA